MEKIPPDIKTKIENIVKEKYSEKNDSFIHNRYLDYCCGYSLASKALSEQKKAAQIELDLVERAIDRYIVIMEEKDKALSDAKAEIERLKDGLRFILANSFEFHLIEQKCRELL